MTNSSAPLPTTQRGQDLLQRLQMRAGDTLYGLALSGPEGDERATRILVGYIKSQLETLKHDPAGMYPNVKVMMNRYHLAEHHSKDQNVPLTLRAIFGAAVDIAVYGVMHHRGGFDFASPDAHHFAAKWNEEAKEYKVSTTTLLSAPPEFHYATLLMNPYNPAQPAVNELSNRTVELPLEEGRMDRQANLIADITGLPKSSILRAGFANAVHVAAWRYDAMKQGVPVTKDQATASYFLKVAKAANELIDDSGINNRTFNNAIRHVEAMERKLGL